MEEFLYWLKSDLDVIYLPNYTINDDTECRYKKHSVIEAYRPPNPALQLFNTHFFDLINGIPNKNKCTNTRRFHCRFK